MKELICFAVLVAVVVSQQHHHGGNIHFGNTHDHAELGSITFYYDYVSHDLAAMTHSTCYLMHLNSHQQSEVHQHNGLEKFELMMMQMIDGGEDQIQSQQMTHHSLYFSTKCKGHTIYQVRPQPTTTRPF